MIRRLLVIVTAINISVSVRMKMEAELRHSTLFTLFTQFHSPLLSSNSFSLNNFSTAIDRTKASQLTRRSPPSPPCSMCHSTSESCYTGECAVGSCHVFPLCILYLSPPLSLFLIGLQDVSQLIICRTEIAVILSYLISSYVMLSYLVSPLFISSCSLFFDNAVVSLT